MSTPVDKDISEQEQEKLVEEAKNVVKVHSFQMKRALDGNKLMEALKSASNMLNELRTDILASDELRRLELYLLEDKHGKTLSELYELVQYAGNVLPRLYLVITVGSVYIKSKKAPAKDVLKDLVEMCRGVQHPTRGLFLRTYLSEMTKDKLPEEGSEYAGAGGEVKDAMEFVLSNFVEMNKLWVRMQHQGQVRDRERREKERKQLSTLVGKNLSRLSQLEGVDVKMYKESILPKILDQVVQCKDVIAQQYLMEIVIQVFSDDFHLQTLQLLLKTCPKLEDGVDVKSIIGSLIDRISDFLLANPEIKPSQNVFTLFSKYINKVLEEREDMPLDNVLALQVSLLNLALRCYNDKKEYIDQVLVYSAKRLSEARAANPAGTLPRAVMDQAMKLLNTPLDSFKNILRVLQLESYPTVIEALDFDNRRRIAIAIIRSCLDNGTTVHIPEAESAEKLFNLLKPLLQDVADKKDLDDEDFADEQNLVASLLHLLRSPNAEDLFGMLIAARKTFEAGGLRRRKYTYPSLFFVSMRLVQQLLLAKETDADWEKKARKVVQFALALVSGLQETDAHHVALNCALQCAQIASVCKFDNVAYNAFDKAFREIYEEKIVKSKEQYDSIRLIVATLRTLHCFDEDTYDKFVAQTAKAANNLMNRADQCRAIAMCSHLLWVPDAEKPIKDPQRVFECLLKASKIADSIGDETNASLFVEILNEYLFFFQENNEATTTKRIAQLTQHVKTSFLETPEQRSANDALTNYFRNTQRHVALRKEANDPRFESLDVVTV